MLSLSLLIIAAHATSAPPLSFLIRIILLRIAQPLSYTVFVKLEDFTEGLAAPRLELIISV